MLRPEVHSNFIANTDDTGRFIVLSSRTGKKYYVEPIVPRHNDIQKWGSIDPATGKLMNKKGHDKHRGAIDADESLITPENGFKNIILLDVGTSPLHAIDVMDAKYPSV